MKILVLDCEEIKNPYIDTFRTRDVFAEGVQALLSHAHPIDIDKSLIKYLSGASYTIGGKKVKITGLTFSQFLLSQLKTDTEETR